MKMSEAIATRTKALLKEKNMTKYALCKKTLIPKSTLQNILDTSANDVILSNVLRIATGLDMTLAEFFDCELFKQENFENL